MSNFYDTPFGASHDHVFLGEGHEKNERKTWAVIVLCTLMMAAEIIGGSVFGSLALVAATSRERPALRVRYRQAW